MTKIEECHGIWQPLEVVGKNGRGASLMLGVYNTSLNSSV